MLKSRAMFSGSLCLLALALSLAEVTLADEVIYYGDEPATIVSNSSELDDAGYTNVSDDSCCTNQDSTCGSDGGCQSEGDDGSCGDCGEGCGHGCRRQCASQQESWYNCGCNGSYKFPVPPLYTYMWPGLYSQQLVTNYHSPWRFPPLKPYTNEAPTGEPYESAASSQSAVRPVSAEVVRRRSAGPASPAEEGRRVESTSVRIRRLYQIR